MIQVTFDFTAFFLTDVNGEEINDRVRTEITYTAETLQEASRGFFSDLVALGATVPQIHKVTTAEFNNEATRLF